MSEYPDDVRQYDSDPRSPFYVEPPVECFRCGKGMNEEEAVDLEEGYFCQDCTFCETNHFVSATAVVEWRVPKWN